MAIESRIPTEGLNIKELQTEMPENDPIFFDADKEITPDDWRKIRAESGFSESGQVGNFLNLKILDPNIEFKLSDEWRIKMETMLKQKSTTNFGSQESVGFLGSLKMLKIKLNLDPDIIDKATNAGIKQVKLAKSKALNHKWNFWNFAYDAENLKLLKPDFDLGINEQVIQETEKELEEQRKHDLEKCFEFAARIKLLNIPLDPHLSPEEWQQMKIKLHDYKANNDWYGFVKLAKDLKILSAQEIKIDDNGLKLVMPERQRDVTAPKIPESKKF